MKDLIERLERLDGPCRECDAEIARTLRVTLDSKWAGGQYLGTSASKYTESIDAALTLIPDGWFFGNMAFSDGEHIAYYPAIYGDDSSEESRHKSLPIALCIAALRARQSLLIDGER